MSNYRREVLYSKLNSLAAKAAESSYIFCKLRGNPFVELAHWVHQLVELPRCDLHCMLDEFKIDSARLAADLTRKLESLERGTSASPKISPKLDRAIEAGYLQATLRFQVRKVRTGHVLYGVLMTPELRPALIDISSQFSRIDSEGLAKRFGEITAASPEGALDAEAGVPEPSAFSPAGEAMPPAAFGKQEALRRFTVDMTQSARHGELDAVVGRDAEIRQLVDVLMRRRQNNPIITGEAGVGKTAIVEGFAQRIAAGDIPPALRDVTLRSLDVGLLQAGASMKGEFEQRLRQVIDEVQSSLEPIILFIDEAHTLIGAGGAKGTGDAANLLKPALARGKLRTIAATTWSEYKEHIEPDPALTRRFQVVRVEEPTEPRALQMLRGLVATLEKHHQVQVLDQALEASVKLSRRYIPSRQLPDKAVSLLDTACARVAISHHAVPGAIEDGRRAIEAISTELDIIRRERAMGVDTQLRESEALQRLESERDKLVTLEVQWESEKSLLDRILSLRERLRPTGVGPEAEPPERRAARQTIEPEVADAGPQYEADLQTLRDLERELKQLHGERPLILPTVDSIAVAAVVSDWTGIPLGRMVRDELEAILRLPQTLGKRIIGQDHALQMIADRLQTSRAGLENPKRPIGVFMLVGPSGVGKTETALALAEALYGGEENVITINMSEYQERHTVSLLKGAPPGYVGYGKGGVLTEAVRRRPYSVVLLDEVEKAHKDVHELFFQVFDKGSMEDGTGRLIDFKNTLILLTSNVGTEEIMLSCNGPVRPAPEVLEGVVQPALQQVFPAALLGRMTAIPYYPLNDEMLGLITRLQLDRIAKRLREQHGVAFEYADDVIALMRERCTDRQSGARAIDRILSVRLLPRISRQYLASAIREKPMASVRVTAVDGDFELSFT